jgi:hypothetical protein
MRGYCGNGSAYCGAGCQAAFGRCAALAVSSDGSCGGPARVSCQGSDYGNCCSMRGYCGANASYCGAGCQSEFGTCFPAPSTTMLPSSSGMVLLPSSTAAAAATPQQPRPARLSAGAIAGATIGSVVAAANLALLAWLVGRGCSRRRKAAAAAAAAAADATAEKNAAMMAASATYLSTSSSSVSDRAELCVTTEICELSNVVDVERRYCVELSSSPKQNHFPP